ncbi:hypothetical protein [Gramella sp. AN32]|uniref:Uncharacterized protein n=1 Tax=Christiangramia antarctica TaxID=2058158 RepID=A0ABW5X385_9FLAO|nr:hypothetical protein [Gramella sp. AN32]MCM4155071.1 hypothetical protein [Gramella sp. AN32]
MKKFQYVLNIGLLLVFLSTTATNSFSYFPNFDHPAEKGEVLKSKDLSKTIFSEEVEEVYIPSNSENEDEFKLEFSASNSTAFCVHHSKVVAQAPPRCLDLKSILKVQIFPFHSFW